MKLRRTMLAALAILLASGLASAAPAGERGGFVPPPIHGARPWTSPPMDDAPDKFAFAVVTDLESGYRAGVFDVAVAELALLRPAFVMTVGDQIEGGIEDEAKLDAEWDAFDARLAGLHAPYFHAGGNHDLTNLAQRRVWARRYGPRYYHFSYRGVLFLVLDTEDYSEARMTEIHHMRSDYLAALKTDPARARTLPYASLLEAKVGEVGPGQSAYFERVLKANPHPRWTFVIMHKPVWRRSDGRGLDRIEAALKGRPYTVLGGHLHRYGYTVRNGTDYINLGTTGGERAFDGSPGAVDHLTWITMTRDGPSIANIRLDGVFDRTGAIPGGGDRLCLGSVPAPCGK